MEINSLETPEGIEIKLQLPFVSTNPLHVLRDLLRTPRCAFAVYSVKEYDIRNNCYLNMHPRHKNLTWHLRGTWTRDRFSQLTSGHLHMLQEQQKAKAE